MKKFPTDERGWVAARSVNLLRWARPDAEKSLAEAKSKVPQDKRLATSAMGREKIGPPEQATKEYDAWLAANPVDLRAIRGDGVPPEQVKATAPADGRVGVAGQDDRPGGDRARRTTNSSWPGLASKGAKPGGDATASRFPGGRQTARRQSRGGAGIRRRIAC